MSTGTTLALVLLLVVVLAVIVLLTTARRSDARRASATNLSRETRRRDRSLVGVGAVAPAETAPTGREVERSAAEARTSTAIVPAAPTAPVPYVPPDDEAIGVTRRHFLNLASVSLMGISLAAFGAAVVAFLWPKLGAGFGSKIAVGSYDDVVANIRSNKNFYYLAAGRAWMTEYPKEGLPKAQKVYSPPIFEGMKAGLNALYQKCPHLGCRVPNCESSQWFECPCHGSQYNRVGEKKGGPAPRGMDRFAVTVANGNVTVDTSTVYIGPAIGTNTTGQEAEGPHCIGGGEHK
jgi:cytochrome b6-f complex iron-sulfur subunit